MTTAAQRSAAFLGALLTALLALGVAAPAASAHAALLSTTPANNEIAGEAPREVTLTFGEAVSTGLGASRVLAANGDRADTGQASRSDDDRVVHLALREGLAQGSYVVLWRVVSADSHPVSGTFVFSIGKASKLTGYSGRITPPRSPSLLLGTTRGLGFAALLVLLGGALFCVLLWPDGVRTRAVRVVLAVASAVELVAAVAAVYLQGPYAAGLGAGHALDRVLLSAVLKTQYGEATATRAWISLLALGVCLLLRTLPRRAGAAALVVLGVAAAGTWSAAGHAGTGDLQPWTFGLDLVHLVTVSAWVGGLVLLGIALRRRWTDEEAAQRLPRWSRLATIAVLGLVASGVFASWREVRSVTALFSTAYGGLLVAKTTLVLFMLMLGAIGRAYIRKRYVIQVAHAATAEVVAERPAPSEDGVAQLRRTTRVETITAAIVLAVTAVLVQTPPAASAYAPPYSGVSSAGPYKVQVDLYPAHKGLNGLHLYTLGPDGRTVDVAEVSGTLTRLDGDTITVAPKHKSLGHYEDLHVIVPSTGTYTLTLQVRVSDIDSYATTQRITVR
ncbi:MAG: copper transport protein [Actinomycetota bacterium]|jgi:copper transport protein|nr:copper transport protein [Actinomycetota bacterium]